MSCETACCKGMPAYSEALLLKYIVTQLGVFSFIFALLVIFLASKPTIQAVDVMLKELGFNDLVNVFWPDYEEGDKNNAEAPPSGDWGAT